jgi:carbon-monoxide dehydrogenase medium subunit
MKRSTSVILADFEYLAPKTLEEALRERKEKKNSFILAGGTDLIPKMRDQSIRPSALIDLTRIKELNYIKEENGQIKIGSTTTISQIIKSGIIRKNVEILYEACKKLGNPLTRNKATIGGNLCNASPAADTATPLLVSGAELILKSLDGERRIPIEEFFEGPGKTILRSDEILTEIRVSVSKNETRTKFLKVGLRKANAVSIVNCAVSLRVRNKIVKETKIGLGAVAPIPILAKEAQKVLMGKKLREDLIEECAQAASKEVKPIDDVRGSAKYRRFLVEGLLKKALRTLMKEVTKE